MSIRKKIRGNNTLSTISLFVLAILIALLTKTFVAQPYVVEGQSMETTLQSGDRLIVNKLPLTLANLSHDYVPHRGDIIIFNQSGLPGYTGSKQLIKRVVGLPGERIIIKDGQISLYNKSKPNGFNPDTDTGYKISASYTSGLVDVTLDGSQLYVCGDNRNNSEDSRYFGPISTNQVVGKLSFRIMPLGKIQRF